MKNKKAASRKAVRKAVERGLNVAVDRGYLETDPTTGEVRVTPHGLELLRKVAPEYFEELPSNGHKEN